MTYYPGTNSPHLAQAMGLRLDGPLIECDECKTVLRLAADRPPPEWFFRGESPRGWQRIGKGGDAKHKCPRCKEKTAMLDLNARMPMNIKRLRKEHPHIVWSVVRGAGFGAIGYRGVGDDIDVNVMLVATTLFDEYGGSPGDWMVSGKGANRGFEPYSQWKGGR